MKTAEASRRLHPFPSVALKIRSAYLDERTGSSPSARVFCRTSSEWWKFLALQGPHDHFCRVVDIIGASAIDGERISGIKVDPKAAPVEPSTIRGAPRLDSRERANDECFAGIFLKSENLGRQLERASPFRVQSDFSEQRSRSSSRQHPRYIWLIDHEK